MNEILVDNRNGTIVDISEMVPSVQWKTERIGKPGVFEMTFIKNQDHPVTFNNGDPVRFKYDGRNIFYGYIFDIDESKGESVKIKAYDQIRYLKNKDTYVFSNKTATQILKRIASDFNLQVGQVEDTSYRIPALVEDGKALIDIISKALDLTLINSNQNFVLFDDFGSLSIQNIENLVVEVLVGDESLMYDYQFKRSIDNDTYNKVKLYRDNKDTGKRDIFVGQDSANIEKWGALQLYQSVDENMNQAQIKEMLDQLMAVKNRESRTLKIPALGDPRIRAGCYVPIEISDLGINQPFLVDVCTHKFEGSVHTMDLELKVI